MSHRPSVCIDSGHYIKCSLDVDSDRPNTRTVHGKLGYICYGVWTVILPFSSLKSKMLQMPYKAIRQMYTKYKQRPKFYVDWHSFLTHDDINYLQVGWSLGLCCLSRVKTLTE